MPRSLPLALDIADTVSSARRLGKAEAAEIARQLVESHPEAEVSAGEIIEVLRDEMPGLARRTSKPPGAGVRTAAPARS